VHSCAWALQGLPPVHFSAQPEPFSSLNLTEFTQRVPHKVLTSSREVDECKPLAGGAFDAMFRHGGADTAADIVPALLAKLDTDPVALEVGRCRMTPG
jgi:hypothetical protein